MPAIAAVPALPYHPPMLTVLVLIAVFGGAALITNLFVAWMYNRCAECGSLNAHRRTHCRVCNTPIEAGAAKPSAGGDAAT